MREPSPLSYFDKPTSQTLTAQDEPAQDDDDDDDDVPTAPRALIDTGEHGQPVLTALSIHDDRLKAWAAIPYTHELLTAERVEQVRLGPFTLVPTSHGAGICNRLYDVFHNNESDPVATLMSDPRKGQKNMVWFTPANHHNYDGRAIPLANLLLTKLRPLRHGLSHYEVAGDAPGLINVIQFIHGRKLVRKGGRTWGIKGTGNAPAQSMYVGSSSSAKYANMYPKGVKLSRENKQYQGRSAVAAGVVEDDPYSIKSLMRMEWNLKPAATRLLRYKGQPVTLRTLVDPLARLSIFKEQTEYAFNFKYPGRCGATVPFFAWDSIETNYRRAWGIPADGPAMESTIRLPRPARKSNSTYGAKQAVRKLIADSRPGDYLAQAIRPALKHHTQTALADPERVRVLCDTLSAAGCGVASDLLTDIVTAWATGAAADAAGRIATAAPGLLAAAISSEHNIYPYLSRQRYLLRRLPPVNRLPDSIAVPAPS
jgi:hypothetical protein